MGKQRGSYIAKRQHTAKQGWGKALTSYEVGRILDRVGATSHEQQRQTNPPELAPKSEPD